MISMHEVGPLRVGSVDVVVRTNSAAFALVARSVFVDLRSPVSFSLTRVVFEVIEHSSPDLHWSIHRDGEPCELQLRDDAVIVQLQWEFNRVVIETQRTVIHAAAVEHGGGALLVAGQSYSGKTTLAGWLAVHRGCGYLADEASAIDEQTRVRPYPRPLGLRSDSPLAQVAEGVASRFMPDEVLTPASVAGGRIGLDPVPVQLIVFPQFQADSTLTVVPISQADALERLAHLTPGLVRHGRDVFERLGRVVVSAPAVELTYPHVDEGAAAVVEIVGRR